MALLEVSAIQITPEGDKKMLPMLLNWAELPVPSEEPAAAVPARVTTAPEESVTLRITLF